MLTHELTDGVAQINIVLGALASGGRASTKTVGVVVAARGEVLTILEVNSQESLNRLNLDNAVFFTNVADWIGYQDPMLFSD